MSKKKVSNSINPQDEKFMHTIPHPIHTLLQKAHNRSRPKPGRSK